MGESNHIDLVAFGQARRELGANFIRIIGYFKEDGVKSVAAIESGMHAGDSASLVRPAHTLKGESRQFGAERLGDLAEEIEIVARRLVETQEQPDELVAQVVELRKVFEETMALLDRETNPLVQRRTGFGRRPVQAGQGSAHA